MEAIRERLEQLKEERQAKIKKAQELRKCEDDYQKDFDESCANWINYFKKVMENIKKRLEQLKEERQAKIKKAQELRKCEDDYRKRF